MLPIQLDLSQGGHAFIPDTLDTRLTSISLASNRIYSLHGLERLTQLIRIDLSGNKIVSVSGIEVLDQLIALDLSRNSISTLDGLGHLARLQYLNVSDNNLSDLDAVESNTALTYLNASTNAINVWPRFHPLERLEVLNLNDNQLGALRQLNTVLPASLRQLKLARNQIAHLSCLDSCQNHLNALQSLDLAGNACVLHNPASIPSTLSCLFPSLVMLDGQSIPRATSTTPHSEPTVANAEPDVSNRDVKIQMWKQKLMERKQHEQTERQRLQDEKRHDERTHGRTREVKPSTPLYPYYEVAMPTPPSIATQRQCITATSTMFLAHDRESSMEPNGVTQAPSGGDKKTQRRTTELQAELTALQDHVHQMRKYMKVWIKREQWLRLKSAICIQTHFRGYLVRQRYPKPMAKKTSSPAAMSRIKDSEPRHGLTFVHASSHVVAWSRIPPNMHVFHLYMQSIQKVARGYFTRKRLTAWQAMHAMATQIQRLWRGHVLRTKQWRMDDGESTTILQHLRRMALRLGALERQFRVQDEAMADLWAEIKQRDDNAAREAGRRFVQAAVHVQAIWRGHRVRKAVVRQSKSQQLRRTSLPALAPLPPLVCHKCDANAQDIDALRREVQTLKELVLLRDKTPPNRVEVKSPHTSEQSSPGPQPLREMVVYNPRASLQPNATSATPQSTCPTLPPSSSNNADDTHSFENADTLRVAPTCAQLSESLAACHVNQATPPSVLPPRLGNPSIAECPAPGPPSDPLVPPPDVMSQTIVLCSPPARIKDPSPPSSTEDERRPPTRTRSIAAFFAQASESDGDDGGTSSPLEASGVFDNLVDFQLSPRST
ncbi:Aste57867_5833 [Aphanomyces stellatus]|uniref:Aste57867_5833 protein n=1 Tax=Aphanomyces stellatus TaxID=120398 RepID=A0A485KHL0_9STRA|nr:hypothetical protein As57867_005819 [Aphanomyces stellatus]VFT82856.1 Aste57867_5833 [Aphanomyces stellatus]